MKIFKWEVDSLTLKIALGVVCFIGLYVYVANIENPVIVVTSSQNNTTTKDAKILIKGRVEPADTKLSVFENGASKETSVISVVNGEFSYNVSLNREVNVYKFVAWHSVKTSHLDFTINRLVDKKDRADFIIDSPKDGAVVESYPLKISGTFLTDNSVIEKSFWLEYDNQIKNSGDKFSAELGFLSDGENDIEITVTNKKSLISITKHLKVTYAESYEQRQKIKMEKEAYKQSVEDDEKKKALEDLEKFRQERYNAERKTQTYEELQKIKRELEYQKSIGN